MLDVSCIRLEETDLVLSLVVFDSCGYSCCVSLTTGLKSRLDHGMAYMVLVTLLFSNRGYVDSVVAAKENSAKYGYMISPNRELVALGEWIFEFHYRKEKAISDFYSSGIFDSTQVLPTSLHHSSLSPEVSLHSVPSQEVDWMGM